MVDEALLYLDISLDSDLILDENLLDNNLLDSSYSEDTDVAMVEVTPDEEVMPGEEVELEVVDFRADVAQALSNDLELPCIVIQGVNTLEELNYFSSLKQTEDSIPLFINFDNLQKKIGNIDVSLKTLLNIKLLGDYQLLYYNEKGERQEIMLNQPISLLQFMKI